MHALPSRACGRGYVTRALGARLSELVQLKLNIETSVGESTPTEAKYEVPLPLVEVGVSR